MHHAEFLVAAAIARAYDVWLRRVERGHERLDILWHAAWSDRSGSVPCGVRQTAQSPSGSCSGFSPANVLLRALERNLRTRQRWFNRRCRIKDPVSVRPTTGVLTVWVLDGDQRLPILRPRRAG